MVLTSFPINLNLGIDNGLTTYVFRYSGRELYLQISR